MNTIDSSLKTLSAVFPKDYDSEDIISWCLQYCVSNLEDIAVTLNQNVNEDA